MSDHRANELLGYPPDARLLIINADDFGMYHGANAAVLRGFTEGVIGSTTLMTPCPWGMHGLHLLHENTEIPFGIHLTLICEPAHYRWGPLSPKAQVPSLVDEAGYFYSYPRIPEFLAQAKLDEIEVEFRAQIQTVLSAGLLPTHIDFHCLNNGGRADIFEMALGLAKEYGLAVRVNDPALKEALQGQGLPTIDHSMMDSFRIDSKNKTARYVQMLRDLRVGLTEWAVHPCLGNEESQAVDNGWPIRKADFDFLISEDARDTINEEGIILLNYRSLQTVWNATDFDFTGLELDPFLAPYN